jgi:hypothetical protein
MPTKTLYVSDSDEYLWAEGVKLAKRRGMSMSALLSSLVKDYVAEGQSPLAKAMGLPPGFKPPASMRDPIEVKLDQIAEDLRVQVRELVNEKIRIVEALIAEEKDET